MKTKPLKIAVVGCGYWGPNLIRNFAQIPNVSVEMVCDKQPDRLVRMKQIYPQLITTDNYTHVLQSSVDAVVIATPLASHFILAKKALIAGKHILIEKPFVKTVAQGQELILLADSKKKIIMIDNTFEYSSAVNYTKQLNISRKLGDIYTIDMIRVNLGMFQKDINVVWDLAYHDLSIVYYIFGALPLNVICVGKGFIHEKIEDTAHLLLQYPNKMMVSIHVSWLEPKKIRRVTIVGSKKMLVYDDLASTDKITIFDKGVSFKTKDMIKPNFYETYDEFTYLYRSGDIFVPRLDQEEPLFSMAKHFINSVQLMKSPRSDGRSALQIIKILTAAQRSLKSGKRETIHYD